MVRIATPKSTSDHLIAHSGPELDSDLRFEPARHYDPAVRRFINDEPVGYAGDADQYCYAGNEPKR